MISRVYWCDLFPRQMIKIILELNVLTKLPTSPPFLFPKNIAFYNQLGVFNDNLSVKIYIHRQIFPCTEMRITSELVLTLPKQRQNKTKPYSWLIYKFIYKVEAIVDLELSYQILKCINNPQPCVSRSSSRCLCINRFSWNVYTRKH